MLVLPSTAPTITNLCSKILNNDNNSKDVLEPMNNYEESFGQNESQLIEICDDKTIGLSNKSFSKKNTKVIDICDDDESSNNSSVKKTTEVIDICDDDESSYKSSAKRKIQAIDISDDEELSYKSYTKKNTEVVDICDEDESSCKSFKKKKTEVIDICDKGNETHKNKNVKIICISEDEESNENFSIEEENNHFMGRISTSKDNSDDEKFKPIICTTCPLSEFEILSHKKIQAAQYCDENYLKYLKEWLSKGSRVNARDWAGMTLLHVASKFGNTKLLELLLEHPEVHLNIEEINTGYTPMMLASKMGHCSAVKILIEHKGKCPVNVHTLNKVLISASHHQQWDIVHKILENSVELGDLALESAFDCAKLNGKLDIVEDISSRFSHIISDKILLQATINQEWKFVFLLIKSQKEFRKETMVYVFSEAFMILDMDIMQYFFTQNYSAELLEFDTLITVFGKICGKKDEMSRNVASLLDAKVMNIITPFKINTSNHSSGSVWSHNLDGNIQAAEICKHSVMSYCKLERHGCPCLHATENFHWQISFTWNCWINLTKKQSQCIEEAYCNPEIDNCYPFYNSHLSTQSMQEKGIMSLLGNENWVVDFKYNIITNYLAHCNTNYTKLKHMKHVFIRRLAVKDSVANQHQWYFKENDSVWVNYGNRGPTLDSIENFYSMVFELPIDQRFFKFINNTQSYTLDFNRMEQTNITTGTKRFVKRRPKKHLTLYLRFHNKIIKADGSNLREKVDIPEGEYKEIFDKLKHRLNTDNINGSHIESVEKVNNPFLKRSHKLRLEMMETQYADVCKIFTKKLLHGTKKECVERIICENFDWRLNGKSNGKVFGQGAYFTPDSNYALSYAPPDSDGKRYIIISSIIVGCMVLGNKNMEKPPINPATRLPYDTSVNNIISPNIYVKYNRQEYCPEYVVTIQKNSYHRPWNDII
ncbi:unnamed protein product [Meganyctiphanes norvegica]|uniref:Poly [ADP-ribose] polymerase n=1 Tax=Meganyctiphanes norvegica TaxID=48144 RepID=A0AAV2S2S4_MEGNR